MNTRFKTLLFMICTVIICYFDASAQSKYRLNVKSDSIPYCLGVTGSLSAYGQAVYGAEVRLYKGNSEVQRLVYYPGKKFEFLLERNAVYTIEIAKKGLLTRCVRFETNLPANARPAHKEELYYFDFELLMVKQEDLRSQTFADFPIAVVRYDEQRKVFDYSKAYTQHIKREIGQAGTD